MVLSVLLTPSGGRAMNRKKPGGHTQKMKLNINHVSKTKELFLKITANQSDVSKNAYVKLHVGAILYYILPILCGSVVTWPMRIRTRGPTGGALVREYYALRGIVDVMVRQSIVCRYGCRRNVIEVCGYRTYVYLQVCV